MSRQTGMNQLVPKRPSRTITSTTSHAVVPALIAAAGDHAARRFIEYFAAMRSRSMKWKVESGKNYDSIL
jgi:hypothetical protein